jgi:hypothetical protein
MLFDHFAAAALCSDRSDSVISFSSSGGRSDSMIFGSKMSSRLITCSRRSASDRCEFPVRNRNKTSQVRHAQDQPRLKVRKHEALLMTFPPVHLERWRASLVLLCWSVRTSPLNHRRVTLYRGMNCSSAFRLVLSTRAIRLTGPRNQEVRTREGVQPAVPLPDRST